GNEGVSLLENMGNLGVPLSKKLKDVLEQLKTDNDKEDK
ncbi:MAG: phage holin family protein, partial [Oscillospiraceae bacterium]|nr:phage holin family protein [Oscillospiraceae bacterium]